MLRSSGGMNTWSHARFCSDPDPLTHKRRTELRVYLFFQTFGIKKSGFISVLFLNLSIAESHGDATHNVGIQGSIILYIWTVTGRKKRDCLDLSRQGSWTNSYQLYFKHSPNQSKLSILWTELHPDVVVSASVLICLLQ